jgi:hypothetical protein
MKIKEVLNYIKKHYKDGMLIQCATGHDWYTVFYLDKLKFDSTGIFIEEGPYGTYHYVYYSKDNLFAKTFTEVNKKMVLIEKRFGR